MNKFVKFGIPVVILLMFSVFLFDIGSPSTDYQGELVFDEQAPGTYELEMYNPFFNYYNVYVEEGKSVNLEILNSNEFGASYNTCEEFLECDLIEENAPMEGFVCIGRLYGGEAEFDSYSIRFSVAENDSAEIKINQVKATEEYSAAFQFIPILIPLLIFGYVSLLMRTKKGSTSTSPRDGIDFSSLSNEADNMEQRFMNIQNSGNLDTRIRWEDGILKVTVGGNSSLAIPFGMLLASLIALAYVFNGITSANWSMTGIAVFAFFILSIFFLLNLRGEQILYVHDEHLEVLYERLNITTPEIHVNTPRSDITEIKYYTRWVESTDSDGDSSSYKVHVTGIVLKNPDDERSLTQSKYAIPLVEIQSGTQTEAENMADALNYLLQIKDLGQKESSPNENFWAEVHKDAVSTIAQQRVSSSESGVSIGTPIPISEEDPQGSLQNVFDGFIPHEAREVVSSVIAQTCIAIFVGGLVFITIGFGTYDRDIYWGLDVIITANSFTWAAIMASLGILYIFAVYAAYSKRTYIAHLGLENTVVVRTSWFNKPQKEKMRIDLTPTSFISEYNYHSYDEESGQSNTSTNYEIRTPGQQSLKLPDGFSRQKVLEVTGLTLQVSEDSYSADFD
ncbi:MAG: hypothetical protein HN554_05925 [Euryarchaeota archaeon]|nr:hypothetical protein [Euryarchaeota archaeon]